MHELLHEAESYSMIMLHGSHMHLASYSICSWLANVTEQGHDQKGESNDSDVKVGACQFVNAYIETDLPACHQSMPAPGSGTAYCSCFSCIYSVLA